MASNLPKKTYSRIQEQDYNTITPTIDLIQDEFYYEDNTEALDLTTSTRKTTLGSPPPLIPLVTSGPSDADIQRLRVGENVLILIVKSEQLTRGSSLPFGSVTSHPSVGFGADDNIKIYRSLRRTDSGYHPYAGGSTSYGHRSSHLSYQNPYIPPQQGLDNPPNYPAFSPQIPPQGYQHSHYENTSGSHRQEHNLQDNSLVCGLFPNGEVRGLEPSDYDELYH